MKNYLLLFSLCLFTITAKSQSMGDMLPQSATYYIKGGKQIAYSKVDSVIMSWGGKFSMEHEGNNIYLSPVSVTDLKKVMGDYQSKVDVLLNQPAKNFTLVDIHGKTYNLENLKGKIVVINFWFTTCSGCIAEMPQLNQVEKAYAAKNVVFLALGRDNATETEHFLIKHDFNFTLLTNAAKVAADYQIPAYPTTMVIDKDGIIRFAEVSGEHIDQILPAVIDKLL